MRLEKRIAAFVLLCCICVSNFQNKAINASEIELPELVWEIGEGQLEGEGRTAKPTALLPIQLGKNVNESFMYTNSINVTKNAVTVKTKKAFMKSLYQNMNARKKKFTIIYEGKYTDIYKGNIETMFSQAWSIDDKNTSDDGDYLYGVIDTYGFSVPYYTSQRAVFSITVTYRESASQLKKVNKKVNKVLKQLRIEEKSRTEKIRAIHDYIAQHIQYDNSFKYYTAYAGFVSKKHTTVCQGYALLFYKMCIESGIPCRYVTGDAGMPHAWNIVKVKGKWYHVDVTWDDLDGGKNRICNYDYFLVGSNTMKGDHVLDPMYKTASFKKKYPIAKKNCVWSIPTPTPLVTPEIVPTPTIVVNTTPSPVTPMPSASSAPVVEITKVPVYTEEPWEDANRKEYTEKVIALVKEEWGYSEKTKNDKFQCDIFLEILRDAIYCLPEEEYAQLRQEPVVLDMQRAPKFSSFFLKVKEKWNDFMVDSMKDRMGTSEYQEQIKTHFETVYGGIGLEEGSPEYKLAMMFSRQEVFQENFRQLYESQKEGLNVAIMESIDF